MSGAMSQVWGMINGMQIFVNLPLFGVEFPPMSLSILNALIAIATFDVLPSDDVFAAAFTLPDEPDDDCEELECA